MFWKLMLWAILTTFVLSGAHAHELEEGTGVICDTAAQVEEFTSLGATADDLKFVNVSKTVCALIGVHYFLGREMKRVRFDNHTYQIVEILVVEIEMQHGWGKIPPEIQYTFFLIEERGA